MAKTRVAVLMGGISSEHDVSLKTGAMVSGSFDKDRYEIVQVVITRDGRWKFPGESQRSIAEAAAYLKEIGVDCVFLALHGAFGEDGRFQGMFDLLGIPYVGSGCAASAIAIDKVRCKALVEQTGVRVARHVMLTRDEWEADAASALRKVQDGIGIPCVAKQPREGSSLGMGIFRDAKAFEDGILDVFGPVDEVMVEQFLPGTEVTCGVLDIDPAQPPRALPVTEIRPVSSTFFDYTAKYTVGACDEITPAEVSEEATRRVQEVALRVHETVGCWGLSRSDMILDGDEPVWIEVNTLPGMTETSLYPQAAAAIGIPFPELIERFVDAAIAKDRTEE